MTSRKRRDQEDSGEAEEAFVVRRASAKIQEGDVRGAVRCINAEETLAPWSEATFRSLQAKHPLCPADRRPSPLSFLPSLLVSVSDIRDAIKSFPPPPGLREVGTVSGPSISKT